MQRDISIDTISKARFLTMNKEIEVNDFGIAKYREIWNLQKSLRDGIIERKVCKSDDFTEYLLIGEHFPVYTLGFHGNEKNLLLSAEQLYISGAELIRIERGGDITYHGPGQVILYPIIDLHRHSLGVKEYVTMLEESVIRLLGSYDIKGERIEGATGVWIGKGEVEERKICAIGVKVTRGITIHGLGLNINTDLSAFSAINPCGFTDKGVTSLTLERGEEINITEVKERLTGIFLQVLKENDLRKRKGK